MSARRHRDDHRHEEDVLAFHDDHRAAADPEAEHSWRASAGLRASRTKRDTTRVP